MEIAAELMRKGIDGSNIIDKTYYEKTYIQNQVMGRVLAESILLMNGACIIGYLRKKDMEFYGVDGKDLDGIVSQLRLTKGVEVAMFLYETETQTFKAVSYTHRSKEGIRIVLELKKDTDVENLTNMLYKKTRLEDRCV